jgi:hypothetical protein
MTTRDAGLTKEQVEAAEVHAAGSSHCGEIKSKSAFSRHSTGVRASAFWLWRTFICIGAFCFFYVHSLLLSKFFFVLAFACFAFDEPLCILLCVCSMNLFFVFVATGSSE